MASVRCSFVTGLRFGGNGGGETQRRCFPGTKNFFAYGGYNSSAVFLPQNHAFTYNGTYYQQVFGTAMGSPVSAVIANMVMEDVEQRALATSSVKPFFWKRYVDDVISVVSGNEAGHLLSHFIGY